MSEHENIAADHVPDPAQSRIDPLGTYRDAYGRLRVPLDRPDADLDGGEPDHADCEGPEADGDDDEVGFEGYPGDDDDDDMGDPREALLSPTQRQALAALPALMVAAMEAPLSAPATDGIYGALCDALEVTDPLPGKEARVSLQRVSAALALRALADQIVEHTVFNAIHMDDSMVPDPVREVYRAKLEADADVAGAWGGIERAADLLDEPAAVTAATRAALARMEELAPGSTTEPGKHVREAYERLLHASTLDRHPRADVAERVAAQPELADPVAALWLLFPADRPSLLELISVYLASPGEWQKLLGPVSAARIGAHIVSLAPALCVLQGADPRERCGTFAVTLARAVREEALNAALKKAADAAVAEPTPPLPAGR